MRKQENKNKTYKTSSAITLGSVIVLVIAMVVWLAQVTPYLSVGKAEVRDYVRKTYEVEGKVNVANYCQAAKLKMKEAQNRFIEKETNMIYAGEESFEKYEEIEPEVFESTFTGDNLYIELVDKHVAVSTQISNRLWNDLETLSSEEISTLVQAQALLEISVDTISLVGSTINVSIMFLLLAVIAIICLAIVCYFNIRTQRDNEVKEELIKNLEMRIKKYEELEEAAHARKREKVRKEREEAEAEKNKVVVSKDIVDMLDSKDEE